MGIRHSILLSLRWEFCYETHFFCQLCVICSCTGRIKIRINTTHVVSNHQGHPIVISWGCVSMLDGLGVND